MPVVSIEGAALAAEVSSRGAELIRLQDGDGRDLLWSGDPAVWSGRSPLLFPVVGRVPGGRVRVEGKSYAMPKHGFASTSEFELISQTDSTCRFRLSSSVATQQHFPFAFALDIEYALAGACLTMVAEVVNRDIRDMPISFGFHPAFRWPLPYGRARERHELRFEQAETAPIRRLKNDALDPQRYPTPIEERRLVLRDELFQADAIIFDDLASRSLQYGADEGPFLSVALENLPHLGIWTKPGGGYICIEPWQGYDAPDGFDGELRDKPGVVVVAPAATRRFAMRVSLHT